MHDTIPRTEILAIMAATVLWAGLAVARADNQVEREVVVTTQTQGDDEAQSAPVALPSPAPVAAPAPVAPVAPVPPTAPTPPTAATPSHNEIVIQTIEPDGKSKQAKEFTWLGLAVEETSEALSSQLGLKSGEGLVVFFLAKGSPAAKADFHKNDVLVELDGQMLVHPLQLRKLVQMHAEGDTVKLTFYRGGKKQTASVKLARKNWDEAMDTEAPSMPGDLQNLKIQINGLNGQLDGLNGELREMAEPMARAGLDKAKMNLEIKRTMEQTRKAIQDAVRRASSDRKSLSSLDQELEGLAGEGVDVDTDATVTVRNKRNSIRTIVQTDETGTLIIEAGAKTHLTARDKHGKLLFEGKIETPAEQEKVPKEVWEKAKPLYDQISAPEGGEPKSSKHSSGKSKFLKQYIGSRVLRACLT